MERKRREKVMEGERVYSSFHCCARVIIVTANYRSRIIKCRGMMFNNGRRPRSEPRSAEILPNPLPVVNSRLSTPFRTLIKCKR